MPFPHPRTGESIHARTAISGQTPYDHCYPLPIAQSPSTNKQLQTRVSGERLRQAAHEEGLYLARNGDPRHTWHKPGHRAIQTDNFGSHERGHAVYTFTGVSTVYRPHGNPLPIAVTIHAAPTCRWHTRFAHRAGCQY